MKVLVLGDGILAKSIVNQTGWSYISRKKDYFDITLVEKYNLFFKEYDVLINCIANTDTYSSDRQKHWDVNYKFVYDLVSYCNQYQKKLVHISTDYIYTYSKSMATEDDVPVHHDSWYGYTKNLSDGLVQLLSKNYLLCRCMHKPYPFPYDVAWVDQIGNFDYVDIISSQIIQLILRGSEGVFNVGTDLKSIFDLALETNQKVKPVHSPIHAPKDISKSCDKLKKELEK